jgi:hypothetical protein
VCTDSCHTVEDSVGSARRVAFDVIQRVEMRIDANLWLPARRQLEQRHTFGAIALAKRARIGALFFSLWMPDNDPTSRDRVFAKFHRVP